MQEEITNFIQTNSPDGGFLQSVAWRKFQEAAGRKTFNISDEGPASTRGEHSSTRGGFFANIIEHELPLVGKYFYIPRGPIFCHPERSATKSKDLIGVDSSTTLGMTELIDLARRNNVGWIRFDPADKKITELIHELIPEFKIKKAPHDMQPREIFVVDIAKSEEQLQSEMKSKTRYNIKIAQKHGVKIYSTSNQQLTTNNYLEEFIRLVKITAKRDNITPHPDEYYCKMLEVVPPENIKLCIAEYENPASTRGDVSPTRGGKIIAANMMIFFGKTVTYLHGASDNEYRNVMATYLLQWQAILDAKAAGFTKYDFGGIKSGESGSWAGITRFKTGFSANTGPIKFPGSYDIVISPFRYKIYRIIQRIKALFLSKNI